VSVKVYDVSGELVRDFDPVHRFMGANEAYWDLGNKQGKKVSSGIFLCKIKAQDDAGETDEVWEKVAVTR
jgi:hypothetical protein